VATFTYLSFQAIRNINLFGLVAGAVLAWNVSEWIARLSAGRPHHIAAWAAPGFVAGLVALLAVGVVTDRYLSVGDPTPRRFLIASPQQRRRQPKQPFYPPKTATRNGRRASFKLVTAD
jgi:hypothetical protein